MMPLPGRPSSGQGHCKSHRNYYLDSVGINCHMNPNTLSPMKFIFALIPGLCLMSCNVEQTQTAPPPEFNEETTRQVLDRHWETFGNNDLEGVMADYDESSVLITPDRMYVGLDEIRQNFVNAFTVFPKDSTIMTLQHSVVKDDLAYIIWSANAPVVKLEYGTDTFIVRNGKIVRQTYAGVVAE